ncbi:hypothetical protein SEA_PHINKY_88 [Microbacterium phage Phinky]|nr:hypothetical protein SEA_PHINKY_88 [Microbacterium phage Phinky]
MHILIDDQKPIEVTPIADLTNDNEESVTALSFGETHKILTIWKELDTRRRDFTYTNSEPNDPADIVTAYTVADRLEFDTIGPLWDGSRTHDAYDLADLSAVLPLKVVD